MKALLTALCALVLTSSAHAGGVFGINLGSWGWPQKNHSIYGLRINLGSCERRAIYGLDIGTSSQTTEDLIGLQVNVFDNIVAGDAIGLQASLLSNTAGSSMKPVLHESPGLSGLQFSLINNGAFRADGFQVALGMNMAGALTGGQIAFIRNKAIYARGFQFGLYNGAQELRGLQIGLLNMVELNLTGLQIGLVNVVNWEKKSRTDTFRVLPLVNAGW